MNMKDKAITNHHALVMMILTALMAAVLCITGPLSIPIGPVSISLQTMVLFISVYILGTRLATLSCTLYLLMGLIGLPVFTLYQGGLGKLAGPTGGYLIGYIPMILIAGLFIWLSDRFRKNTKDSETPSRIRNVLLPQGIRFLGMVIATVVLYTFGTAWYVISTGTPVLAALSVCVIPFIPGDLVKIVAAMGLGPAISKLIKQSIR